MAKLFGTNQLAEAVRAFTESADLSNHLKIVKTWHADYHHGTLKTDKETSREQAYNRDFFVTILGYREKPASPYTFEPKATTLKQQLPDAVLSYTNLGEKVINVAAVVELKGASVALDRPQRREGNMSPVQQGFKYKTQYRRCPFVVVSNFYEFRLYNDNQLDFESWTLDDLIDPSGHHLKFRTFYTLLHAANLTSQSGPSRTENLLTEVRVEQENIGKQFFADYRAARLNLLRDLYRNNPSIRGSFSVAVEKGQKILDRIVFSCFAEDAGLLPDGIISRVLVQVEQSVFDQTVWDVFKNFFQAVDKGSVRLGIANGYNGGLFARDDELDALVVSDNAMREVANLSRYNFTDELSVNILGHIFEQSISDLEEIRLKVQQSQSSDAALSDLQIAGARKAGGIYYTPEYVVRYMIANTLGRYLREVEDRLQNKHGLKGSITEKTYSRRELAAYTEYQSVLQTVRVLDPACGSGAFLVYALDYLLAENQRVDAIIGGSLLGTEEYVRSILRDNLFGVDLNAESIEITKLSLWLKTARRGEHLTSLDENIKCGNSLISDEAVAGEKSFDWHKEFAKPDRTAAFDVIVGNPPYVSAIELTRSLSLAERQYLKRNFKTAVGATDLYIYFFERALKLLKPGGKMSFISPNRYLSASYGKELRRWLVSDFKLIELIDYSDKRVFEDASTYPVITFVDNDRTESEYDIQTGYIDDDAKTAILRPVESSKLGLLNDHILGFLLNDRLPIAQKVIDASSGLGAAGQINATSTAAEAEAFGGLIREGDGFRLINTGTIDPFVNFWGVRPLTKQGKSYLKPCLPARERDLGANRFKLYSVPKIIISKIGLTAEAFYDAEGLYASIDTNCVHSFASGVEPEYVLCWLNSSLYNYVFECLFDGLRMQGGYLLYSSPNLRNTPIKIVSKADQQPFVALGRDLQALSTELVATSSHVLVIARAALPVKIPARLGPWWRGEFADFVSLFKGKLSLMQADDLHELYETYGGELRGIEDRIRAAEQSVDQRFFDMFHLTHAESLEVKKRFDEARGRSVNASTASPE